MRWLLSLSMLACLVIGCRPSAPDEVPVSTVWTVPDGMIEIPGGAVRWPCARNETPPCDTEVDTFAIDRHEVTLEAYASCVDAGECSASAIRSSTCSYVERYLDARANAGIDPRTGEPVDARLGQAPATCLPDGAPAAYCAWVGKRVPTSAEWWRAAYGDTDGDWPWGDEAPDCERAAVCDSDLQSVGGPWPVGSKPGDRSPYGVEDLVGNVMEWTTEGWIGFGHDGVGTNTTMYRPIDDNPIIYGDRGFRCAVSP